MIIAHGPWYTEWHHLFAAIPAGVVAFGYWMARLRK